LLFLGLALQTLAGFAFGGWLAGFSELAISICSFYACAAAVLNDHFGKTVLPNGNALIKK